MPGVLGLVFHLLYYLQNFLVHDGHILFIKGSQEQVLRVFLQITYQLGLLLGIVEVVCEVRHDKRVEHEEVLAKLVLDILALFFVQILFLNLTIFALFIIGAVLVIWTIIDPLMGAIALITGGLYLDLFYQLLDILFPRAL